MSCSTYSKCGDPAEPGRHDILRLRCLSQLVSLIVRKTTTKIMTTSSEQCVVLQCVVLPRTRRLLNSSQVLTCML